MTKKILFETVTQQALWDHEITGQLSDGAWENAMPHDHWREWVDLESGVASDKQIPGVHTSYMPRKQGYNLMCLVDGKIVDLSKRMIAYAVASALGWPKRMARYSEYIPTDKDMSFDEFWKETYDFAREGLEGLDEPMYDTFRSVVKSGMYDRKSVIRDLKAIKGIMKQHVREEAMV